MSWVSVLALSTMIGAWLVGRTSPDEREAVHPAEHQVDQHEVGRVALDELQRDLGARRLGHLVALVLQGQAQGGTDAVVVLEDQELE